MSSPPSIILPLHLDNQNQPNEDIVVDIIGHPFDTGVTNNQADDEGRLIFQRVDDHVNQIQNLNQTVNYPNYMDKKKIDDFDQLMGVYSSNLGNMFSQIHYSPTEEAIAIERKIYLKMMKIIDQGRIDEAQERFDTIIKNAISNNDIGITEPETITYINIFINSDDHYVEQLQLSPEKKKIQIGRHNFCDIHPTDRLTLSRLHLTIVHFMDDKGVKQFALLDMGSLLGLREIDNYTSTTPEIIARQNRGVAWIRPVGQSIHLKLGDDVTILIQTSDTFKEIPKCTVCLDVKRVITLEPCNHFATCSNCSNMIHECPICRGKIQKKRKVNDFDNILFTYKR